MKQLLLSMALLVGLPLLAQKPAETHRSMSDTELWMTYYSYQNDWIESVYGLDKLNPEEKNGKKYLPMLSFTNGSETRVGLLCEEGKRVYFIPDGEEDEMLLFDFGLQVGECVEVGHGESLHMLTVVSCDTIFLGTDWCRRLQMTDDDIAKSGYSRPAYWVEGVGSDLGPLSPYGWGREDCDHVLGVFGPSLMTSRPALFVETHGFTFTSGHPYWSFMRRPKDVNASNSFLWFKIMDDSHVAVGGRDHFPMYYGSWTSGIETIPPTYLFGIREEGGRVYVNLEEYREALRRTGLGDADYIPYPVTDDGEMVLYDFNMQEGDFFKYVTGNTTPFIEKVLSDIYGRKTFTVSNGVTYREGSGNVENTLIPVAYLPIAYLNPVQDGDSFQLMTYGKNGAYINYGVDGYSTVIDEPFTTSVELPQTTANLQHHDGTVYDLSGRKLQTSNFKLQTSPKGVYIQSGKKIIIK